MRQLKTEATALAEEILQNIELQTIELSAVMLKCARLARLLGDSQKRQMFFYESRGYPSIGEGIEANVFEIAREAGRVHFEKVGEETIEKANVVSVGAAEQAIKALQAGLEAAKDPAVSISSSNPHQMIFAPKGNADERTNRALGILKHANLLSQSRAIAYEYATNVLFELEFSETASDIFDSTRNRVDKYIITTLGSGIQKTEAIRQNLSSNNPEDWANAVHSCRRLLQEVADALYPARAATERGGKRIKLGPDNYINRLMCFIEEQSNSSRFTSIVGSSLSLLGSA